MTMRSEIKRLQATVADLCAATADLLRESEALPAVHPPSVKRAEGALDRAFEAYGYAQVLAWASREVR